VMVDADVGADPAGTVESAPPGGRLDVGGAGSWGTRAAEATRAARTEAVRPKANSVSRQGCRGGSRCRGGRSGMAAVVPVRLASSALGAAHQARAVPSHMGRGSAKRIGRRVVPVDASGDDEPRGGWRRAGRGRAARTAEGAWRF